MAQQVEVLQLDINTSALIAKMTATRAEIDKIKQSQKDLTSANLQASDAYTQNAVQLNRLQSSYNQQKMVVTQLTTATDKFASLTQATTAAINKENTSITEAKENNKQLITLRNELNTSTEAGKAALNSINEKLDANNKYIKDNVSGYEKQKIGIGDYKTAIGGALNDTGLFGGKVQEVTQALGNFSGIFTTMKNQVKDGAAQIRSSASATEGMTTAQKALSIATAVGTGAMRIFTVALAATGIGLIIAAVVLLIGYFKTFDPLVDKLEQGMAAFGAAIRVVQQALASLFDSTQDSGKAFSELGDNMAKAAKDAAKLKAAQQDLADLQNSQEVANAKASQQYDELILKSKNRTLTEKERIAFLQKAEAIETANYRQRSALADADLKQSIEAARIKGGLSNEELANLQRNTIAYGTYLLNQGKITDEELSNLKKAELGKISIDAESTKRLEKNQNAQDKLADDAQAKREKAAADAEAAAQKRTAAAQKLIDDAIKKNNEELQLYIASEGIRKKTMSDQLAFEETVKNKRLANLQAEFDAGKISKTKFETDKLNITNEFAKKQADVAVANADLELAAFLSTHESKINSNKFLNDTLYQQELDRINRVSEAEAAAATARLVAGTINADEYNAQIKAIDDKYAADKVATQLAKEEADKEKQAIDLQNKIVTEGEAFAFDLALQTEQENQRYQLELAAAEKTGADTDIIKQKHATIQKGIERSVQDNKLQLASDTFGNLAAILGKESAAGKAMAVAQATMDTYKAATSAYSAMSGIPIVGPVLGAIAAGAAVVAGIANVKKITSTKTASVPTRAEGGAIPTLSNGVINNGSNVVPLSNGDDTLAYVKQGEVILNQEQQARAGGHRFFQSIGVPGFANGGFVGSPSYSQANASYSIDYEKLASSIAQANSTLPAPVVNVTDITSQQNRVQVIESYANLQ